MGAQFRQLRRTVYALKRQYGQSLFLVRISGSQTNFATGRQSAAEQRLKINRAAIMPDKLSRQFKDTFRSANTSDAFQYGGLFDEATRMILVDRRNIPASFKVDGEMWVDFKNYRYKVEDIHSFEEDECILLRVNWLAGTLAPVAIHETLTFSEGIDPA